VERFKLNFNQIIGVLFYSIGAIIESYTNNPGGLVLRCFGLLLFVISSENKLGYTIAFLLSSILLFMGYTFTIMHWPLGNEFFLIGFAGLIVTAFFRYIHKKYRLDKILIFLSFTIITIGSYLKIIHMKFSSELILIGFISIVLSYAFRFIRKTEKTFEDYNKMLLVIFWSISYVFTIFHWPGNYVFSLIASIILWTWLILSMIRELKTKKAM